MFEHFFQEISTNQADLIKSFAIFYLLLVGNYIGSSMFTCFQITYIKKHIWLQLSISFLLFYFLVTLVSDTGKFEFIPPIQKLIYSLFYFLGFLILMRLDIKITTLVLFLIFTIYFLELNKDFYIEKEFNINNSDEHEIYNSNKYWITFDWPYKIRMFKVTNKDFNFINKLERIIYYIILFLLVIGFIAYRGEIHDTIRHSDNLSWIDIVTNTNFCKLKDRKPFLHYLLTGLSINYK